jgi:hypothetical protein
MSGANDSRSSSHFRFVAVFRFGTFAPALRASDSPIAIACLRLFTVPPLPPLPLFNVPLFRFFITRSTLLLAAFPYLRVLFFRVAMSENPPSLDGWPCMRFGHTAPLRSKQHATLLDRAFLLAV